jgi:hypothetical protein
MVCSIMCIRYRRDSAGRVPLTKTPLSLKIDSSTIQRFLSVADQDRALRSLRNLARHDVSRWALTGGVALEIHRVHLRGEPAIRNLNDLDFIVDSFDCIPQTLANDFLFRHIHPFDPPGKTMLQFIDPDSALRMDVFRACGGTMTRTVRLDLPCGAIQLTSLEDLTARTARLVLDLAEGIPVLSKHARDFLGFVNLVDKADVETAWQDHRKPNHPMTFQETISLLHYLIPTHQNLLVTAEHSKDPEAVCLRCSSTPTFKLANPSVILSLLGYC